MAEKNDNLLWILGAGIVAIVLGFFSMGKSVNISAGQAQLKPSCGCGH